MPALNKQTLINLLIDSPLREPIKINLIDIVNNTTDADLPKVYPTITKELEIFQKATDRRLKLADETIKKLAGEAPTSDTAPTQPPAPVPDQAMHTTPPAVEQPAPTPALPKLDGGLQVPPLDLPPLPKPVAQQAAAETAPAAAAPTPTAPAPAGDAADEAALKEIQKELDALKGDAATDAAPTPPTPPSA